MNIHIKQLALSLCFIALISPLNHHVHANDIAKSVRDGRGNEAHEGGSFELGAVMGYIHNPHTLTQRLYDDWHADIDASGEFRYKNFFFEASQGTQDGLNIGYTLWYNKDWSVDVLAASMIGSLSDERDDDKIKPTDNEEVRNKKIENRDTFYLGTGFRITRYINEYVLQYRFVFDTYQNNGVVNTLRVGRGWQYRNWHFSTILSAQYNSAKTNNYLFGISTNQATEQYSEFNADDGVSYSLLFNATRPLTEKWVMRAYVGGIKLSSDIKQSPLLEDNDFTVALLSFNYVFFNL